MFNKTQSKPLHCKDFKLLIEKAIEKLKNGENRLSITDYPLTHACLNGFAAPGLSEQLESDYGILAVNIDIKKNFDEEINLLVELMKEAKVPVEFADWQKGALRSEAGENMFEGVNRHAFAMQLWDWYAIPWRYRNGSVYIIRSPRDVLGTPIIECYPATYFLTYLSSILEQQSVAQDKSLRQLNAWRSFGIIAIIVFGMFLIIKSF